jgi:hypothetical protein
VLHSVLSVLTVVQRAQRGPEQPARELLMNRLNSLFVARR